MLVAARLPVASSSGVDAAVQRWPIRPSMPKYASEKLAYGHAVLDLQHAGQDHGRGRAWEWVLWRVLARAGSGLVGKVATGLGLGREGRERSRLAEHGHDGKAAIFAMFCCYFA